MPLIQVELNIYERTNGTSSIESWNTCFPLFLRFRLGSNWLVEKSYHEGRQTQLSSSLRKWFESEVLDNDDDVAWCKGWMAKILLVRRHWVIPVLPYWCCSNGTATHLFVLMGDRGSHLCLWSEWEDSGYRWWLTVPGWNANVPCATQTQLTSVSIAS